MPRPSDRPARAETEHHSPPPSAPPRHDALALAAFLAGPLAFALDLTLSYFLVPRVHLSGSKAPLHAVTVLSLLVLGGGAAAALRVLRAPAAGATRNEERVAERSRFLAVGGLLLCAFFLGVVVAEALPKLLLSTRD